MGRQRKFSDLELAEAIKEGLSRPQMCARFQISKQALSKRLKVLNIAVGQSALMGRAEMLLEHALDVRLRFVEISDKIRRTSDLLEERMGDGNGGIDKGLMALYIGAKTEERKQLEFLGKVMENYLKSQHLLAVQQAMVEEIGAESAECAARIKRRLGSLHSSGLLFAGDGWA